MLALIVGSMGFSQTFDFNCITTTNAEDNDVSIYVDTSTAGAHIFTANVDNPGDVSSYYFTVYTANRVDAIYNQNSGQSITIANHLLNEGEGRVVVIIGYNDGSRESYSENFTYSLPPNAGARFLSNPVSGSAFGVDYIEYTYEILIEEGLAAYATLTIDGSGTSNGNNVLRYIVHNAFNRTIRVETPVSGEYSLSVQYGPLTRTDPAVVTWIVQ